MFFDTILKNSFMKNIIIPLFCLILFNCSKSNNQHEVKADLVEIIDEDSASTTKRRRANQCHF